VAYTTFAELLDAAGTHGSHAAAAIDREVYETGQAAEAIRERMRDTLGVMREAVALGLEGGMRSRSGLVDGDAARLEASDRPSGGALVARALAATLAVSEVNAAMGRVVAAPTGGASGIVPGVLLTIAEERGLPEDALVDALFAAAAIGAVIEAHTNLSGAAAGCQAEVGAAVAMAAGAATELLSGSPEAAGHATALALQGLLGLVCDPVCGLVEVPCVARNGTATGLALAAIEMALAGVRFPIPFDEVAETLASVGRTLPGSLCETAQGGLAVTATARAIARKLESHEGGT